MQADILCIILMSVKLKSCQPIDVDWLEVRPIESAPTLPLSEWLALDGGKCPTQKGGLARYACLSRGLQYPFLRAGDGGWLYIGKSEGRAQGKKIKQ